MDLSIIANNRWLRGDVGAAVYEWQRRGAVPLKKNMGSRVEPSDLAFIWSGHDHTLLAMARFVGGEQHSEESAALRSPRAYEVVPAIVTPVRGQPAGLTWQPPWGRRGLTAFSEIDEGRAESLLNAVGATIRQADVSDYNFACVARAERAIRDEVLATLETDQVLREAWRDWRRAAEDSLGIDLPEAERVVELPEAPQDADTRSLARFYLREALEPVTWLELASEGASRIEGALVIASRPERNDPLDVDRMLAVGRDGLFEEAQQMRRLFKAYLAGRLLQELE